MLGLTPTILATLGSTTAETAMLSIFARRSILAFLLAAGSPAVFPMRPFEYRNVVKTEQDRTGRFHPPFVGPKKQLLIVLIEYILAGMAVTNVATLGYELGIRSPSAFSAETIYLPLLWSFLCIPIHFFGTAALYNATKPHRRQRNLFGPWSPQVREQHYFVATILKQYCRKNDYHE